MKYLFVGGPADGRWIDTGGLMVFRIPAPPKRFTEGCVGDMTVDIVEYRREEFRSRVDGGLYAEPVSNFLYRLSSLPLETVFEKLMKCYRADV